MASSTLWWTQRPVAASADGLDRGPGPADPTDLPEGIHVELDAAHADCGYSGGTLSGTITFTALSTTHAEGSFDLR